MPSAGLIVKGGLGNQMFQIAAAYAYAKTYGLDIKIKRKKIWDDTRTLYWNYGLSQFSDFLVDELPSNLNLWHQSDDNCIKYITPPTPFGQGVQLDGYFQSSKYFGIFKDDIKNIMKPSKDIFENMAHKYHSLLELKTRVIVVHARRGDYCKNQQMINCHGPLPLEYYTRTLNDMNKVVKDPYFLFVCEEPAFWKEIITSCSEFINESNSYILHEKDEVLTLALLQQFNNFIIANSTFSWWAAWMADAHHVYAPLVWFGPTGPKEWHDIYEPGWTLY